MAPTQNCWSMGGTDIALTAPWLHQWTLNQSHEPAILSPPTFSILHLLLILLRKKGSVKLISGRDESVKRTETRRGQEKLNDTTLL